jgi:hypothetical protein
MGRRDRSESAGLLCMKWLAGLLGLLLWSAAPASDRQRLARRTLVFKKVHGAWLIAHLHASNHQL